MSEAIVCRYYYIVEYVDEMPPHKPTLEGAAYFLLTGQSYEGEPDAYYAKSAPLAKDGDVIELSVLERFADRTAIKGEDGWRLVPEPPADADFVAIGYGPGMGWGESMGGSVKDIAADLDEDGDAEVADIVVARDASAKAVFRLIDGKPSLELLTAKES